MRLDFGKHEGRDLRDVPTQYLAWCLDTLHKLSPYVRAAIRDELDRRGASSRRPTRFLPVAVTSEMALRIIKEGRRALAKTYHPDIGGNSREMVSINASADWLEQVLRSLDCDEVAS